MPARKIPGIIWDSTQLTKGRIMGQSFKVLLLVALTHLASLVIAATDQPVEETSTIADNVGQCGNKPSFGCERGAWSLDGNREATIASLTKTASYRVCVWDAKTTNDIALNVFVDDELVLGPGKRPVVLMPVLDTVLEAYNGASCVLLSGRKIKLRAADSSSPARTPRGFYERLGQQPFVGQHRIEAQPPENGSIVYPIVASRPVGADNARLYRVCLGRFIVPTAEPPAVIVRSQVSVDGTTIPMTTSSCVDVDGSTITGETWAPGGAGREPAMVGLLVY